MEEFRKELKSDGSDPLFDTTDMIYKEFPSDFRQIRFFTLLIVQAAPPGVHVHVVPIKKIIEIAHDPRFGNTKAMLLFETPQDMLRAIEGGVDIKEANLGSMAHSVGKVVVTNAVAMDKKDIETLEAIRDHGVKFDVRKVPADGAENFDAMLKKATSELAAQK